MSCTLRSDSNDVVWFRHDFSQQIFESFTVFPLFFFFGGEVVSTFDPFYHPVSNTMGIIGWRQELGLPYNDFNIKNNQKDKRDWNKVS